MSMTPGARRELSGDINVTPLIDVLLVLLIIFMTILPEHKMGEMTQVPQPPTPDAPIEKPQTPIVIQLEDAGANHPPSLKINQQPVSWDGLEPALRAVYQVRVDRVAFVRGDPDVEFEYVAQAVDITHRAGADRIGLLGKKD
jgi:biopolymer transport protein TolR